MKTRTFVLIAISLILLASCSKKDNKRCWTCTIKNKSAVNDTLQVSQVCDKTKGEIDDMEKTMLYWHGGHNSDNYSIICQ